MPLVFAHLGSGSLAPIQLLPAAAGAILYVLRVRALARAGRPVPGGRQACFYGGVALIVATLVSPLGHLSDELLLAHMTEHLLMADIGALLIVLGLTGPLLAPVLRFGALDRLRVLAHPAIAFPLWAIDLLAWHAPALYQAAIQHVGIHALEHALFVGLGVNMWMSLFGPLPMPPWFGNLAKLVYILAVRLTGALLANVFLWSGTAFYPTYSRGEAYWGLSPVSDQITAGAIAMVEGSVLTICLFAWLFLRSAREAEERQQLLEFAGRHGLELSETRAARAVAAGRGEELRRRLAAQSASPSAGAR